MCHLPIAPFEDTARYSDVIAQCLRCSGIDGSQRIPLSYEMRRFLRRFSIAATGLL